MKRGLHILLLFLIAGGLAFSGCKPARQDVTGGQKQIPREQMIRLMADMGITESALKMKQGKIPTDSIKKIANLSYDTLYIFYRVTPEQFKANLKYYQQDIEDFEAMVDEVIVKLTKARDSVSNLPKDPPPDTIKAQTKQVKPKIKK